MQKVRNLNLLPVNLEPEHTLYFLKYIERAELEVRTTSENNQQRATQDYVRPIANENYSDIACPIVVANKLGLIHMVQQNQFSVAPTEDPNSHLGLFWRFVIQ